MVHRRGENPDGEEASFYYREPDGSFAFWEGVPTLPQLNYGSGRLRDVMYRIPTPCCANSSSPRSTRMDGGSMWPM